MQLSFPSHGHFTTLALKLSFGIDTSRGGWGAWGGFIVVVVFFPPSPRWVRLHSVFQKCSFCSGCHFMGCFLFPSLPCLFPHPLVPQILSFHPSIRPSVRRLARGQKRKSSSTVQYMVSMLFGLHFYFYFFFPSLLSLLKSSLLHKSSPKEKPPSLAV